MQRACTGAGQEKQQFTTYPLGKQKKRAHQVGTPLLQNRQTACQVSKQWFLGSLEGVIFAYERIEPSKVIVCTKMYLFIGRLLCSTDKLHLPCCQQARLWGSRPGQLVLAKPMSSPSVSFHSSSLVLPYRSDAKTHSLSVVHLLLHCVLRIPKGGPHRMVPVNAMVAVSAVEKSPIWKLLSPHQWLCCHSEIRFVLDTHHHVTGQIWIFSLFSQVHTSLNRGDWISLSSLKIAINQYVARKGEATTVYEKGSVQL